MEPLSSTELAAYVAGRLSAERMREITRRAEADPELAARIVVVQELAEHLEEVRRGLAEPSSRPRPDLTRSQPPEMGTASNDPRREVLRYKWITAEKAGNDLGEAALREWVQRHWGDYLMARWLEHLQGTRFWAVLDQGDFGLLPRRFPDRPLLLDRVLDRLKDGQENLDILLWGQDWGIPREPLLEILEALDSRSCLAHRFDL